MCDQRLNALQQWLTSVLPGQTLMLSPLAGDASFRRYFRLQLSNHTYIVMDALPHKENNHAFIAIAQAFAELGIKVPKIIAANLQHGFLLLSDLGDRLYLNELNAENASDLYQEAFASLKRIQACQKVVGWELPHFNAEHISRELQLFLDWFLKQHLNIKLTVSLERKLADLFENLIEIALKQPQVCVHRDYHSRNLLYLEQDAIGVLDFQDAVWGPVTYDAVSLLRDCYIAWPQDQVEQWVLQYYEVITEDSKNIIGSFEQCLLWFDWIGLQRHLKVLGIFTRLYHRDGKPHYLKDIPRIFNYIAHVCGNYSQLAYFRDFLNNVLVSKFAEVTVQ